MTQKIQYKTPPNSKESEMMVLGCMLTQVNHLNVACDRLQDPDFYYAEHQIIFKILKDLYVQDKPADVHLVSEELKKIEKLQDVGGIAYLTNLAQFAGTSAFIEEYINLIKEKAILRSMIQAAKEVEKSAIEEPKDVYIALDAAQSLFYDISQAHQRGHSILIKDLLSGASANTKLPYLKIIEERQEKYQKFGEDAVKVTGIPTHFIDLDKLINGFNLSNLMILAARPGMGKTALATNLAENICFKNDLPIGIFSLEMDAEQLLHRMICSQSEVESDKILKGNISGHEYQRIVECVNTMQKRVFLIDDQPGITITDLRSRARRMKETYDIGFLVIDYLQLIYGSGSSRSMENRQMEISEISRMLKNLARELNIPILCLSQLSRKVEERQGHRPLMSDLRESGCLAGDTLIKNADSGKLHTIKELAERKEQAPIYVYGIDENLKLGKHKLVKAFYSGKKVVYQLTTQSGRSIKASANHPFRTLNGWTRLDRLSKGKHIALPRELDHLISSSGILPNQSYYYPSQSLENLNAAGRPPCVQTSFQTASLRQILKQLSKTVAESSVYWDEIVSIEKLGEENVYDATVENVHNFVANDIIVHNSLEQDSDLVMFLLRPEYYDPYDKPGLAELIVAKNRHGAVGSVQMAYRKEIIQFANYTPTDNINEESNEEAFNHFSPN